MTLLERLEYIISVLADGKATVFASRVGMSTANLCKKRKGTVPITPKDINSILSAYPQVNRKWLEEGEGYPGDLTVDLVKSHYESQLRRANLIIDHLVQQLEKLSEK